MWNNIINSLNKNLTQKSNGEEIRRYGIVFNPTTLTDIAADKDYGIAGEMVKKWAKFKYDHIYILMNSKNIWKETPNVTFLEPTEENLKFVVGALNATGLTDKCDIDILIKGHGGTNAGEYYMEGKFYGRDFVSIINNISPDAQRILRITKCHGAALREYKGVRDENDLFISYSGKKIEYSSDLKGIKEEYNYGDKRDLGILNAEDVDADGNISNWEMFWYGARLMYDTDLPYTRGTIFDPGPEYVDRGFTKKNLKKPFPNKVIRVNHLVEYLKLVGEGYRRGITVIGFPRHAKYLMFKGTYYDSEKDFEKLAEKYNGWVQFIWLNPLLADEVMRLENTRSMINERNVSLDPKEIKEKGSSQSLSRGHLKDDLFKFRVYGEDLMRFYGKNFNFKDMEIALEGLTRGLNFIEILEEAEKKQD